MQLFWLEVLCTIYVFKIYLTVKVFAENISSIEIFAYNSDIKLKV